MLLHAESIKACVHAGPIGISADEGRGSERRLDVEAYQTPEAWLVCCLYKETEAW